MRILFVVGLNPFYGSSASSNRWRAIIENLNNSGVKNDLFIIDGYQSVQEFFSSRKKRKVGNTDWFYGSILYYGNVWMCRVNKALLIPLGRIISFCQILYFKSILKRKRPRAIFVQNSPAINRLLKEVLKDAHDYKVITEINEFPEISLPESLDEKAYIQEIVPRLDLFIVMTETLCKYIKSLDVKPSAAFLHMPMTVDLQRFNTGIASSLVRPYLCYCGSLDNSKDGVDILIESFCRIGLKYKSLKLVLIGWMYDTFLQKQKDIVARYQMHDRVIYLGAKERDEIPPLLNGAEVLCLARPKSKQAAGGFPTKLGEYLATGRPVCVTETGEISNYLTDNVSAFIAEPNSVDAFSAALDRALANPEKASEVGLRGREVAEKHFNKERQAALLFDFLAKHRITE